MNIIEAVNKCWETKTSLPEGVMTFQNIRWTHLKDNSLDVFVTDVDDCGTPYTSLKLTVENGVVLWSNIPVGEAKDLLPKWEEFHRVLKYIMKS